MLNKVMKKKALALLLGGGVMLANGCSLRGLVNQSLIGFARGLGNVPAEVVNQLFITPAIEGLLPVDGDGDGG